MAGYMKKYWKMTALSVLLAGVCFGLLACSDAIRIDTEELINHPGTTVGWLYIGRFGLAFLKGFLGLGTHSALRSGLLFLLFFMAGANLLTYGLYWFSGKNQRYPYGVFLFLYVSSNIWCYQVYFSLQQAEVAFAMLLLIAAAMLSVKIFLGENDSLVRQGTLRNRNGRLYRFAALLVSTVFLVLGLGAYQALAAYYIAVCIALFLVMLPGGMADCSEGAPERETAAIRKGLAKSDRALLAGIGKLILQFLISYGIYSFVANTWFMAASDYMEGQMGWGRLPVAECMKNVLRTAKNILLGYGPRNFSFYTAGAVLAVVLVVLVVKERRTGRYEWSGMRLALFVLGIAGMLASPFLMTIYMGEMLVTRSQFALPVAAAFLGMYGIGFLHGAFEGSEHREEAEQWRRRIASAAGVIVILTVVLQTGYDLRLYATDQTRMEADGQKADRLLSTLSEANGGSLPEKPVIFVGYQKQESDGWCRRTEMYGWSFFEWDYSPANPTGATHRICGFVQAYTGEVLNEDATEEQKQMAVNEAKTMQDFPGRDSVRVMDEYVVVRLSEVEERTDNERW